MLKALFAMNIETPTENACLQKLLEPVDDLSLEFGSDVSDLTDVFEEFHRDSFLRPNADPNKKYLTKTEADWRTVENFTEDFKKSMRDVRTEMAIPDSMFDEASVNEALSMKSVLFKINIEDEIEPIVIDKQNVSRKNSSASEESQTWQVLKDNRKTNYFQVTPPLFDNFNGSGKMEKPAISWQKVNASRLKCEKWLEKIL